MKGIILLSHGPLAEGMYQTSKWFMGEDIEQYDYLCLKSSENPDDFDLRIEEKIKEVDKGEGVILITDIKGGTPCNRCLRFMNDKVELLAGMNLPLVLETLTKRIANDYNYQEIIDATKDGICDVNELVKNL